ncbi:hypothetical protein [Diplocloster modestus]|uniref:Uncharacterized protein n=1 Tax=Diplocloster modestus TaxID=2850322 RepID=A0ABS6KC09_9FIRM|nr:hypothetical protein [Diplocloster modestus]MBU9728033.1 hypothetical protein [Diplocloster modestus]
MANISVYLEKILSAVYGREVRGSIHDAIKAGNDEIESYAAAEAGRESAEQKRQTDTTAAIQRCDTAASNANSVADDLIARREAGEFTGPQGPPGQDGAAVVTQLDPGLFAMAVNSNGHLILTHNDNEPAPPLEIQSGRLVYTVNE